MNISSLQAMDMYRLMGNNVSVANEQVDVQNIKSDFYQMLIKKIFLNKLKLNAYFEEEENLFNSVNNDKFLKDLFKNKIALQLVEQGIFDL